MTCSARRGSHADPCTDSHTLPPSHDLLHLAVLPVVVAEDGEASRLSEPGHLQQHLVADGLGDQDHGRVGGTHGVVSVHMAQAPPVPLLGTPGRQGGGPWREVW